MNCGRNTFEVVEDFVVGNMSRNTFGRGNTGRYRTLMDIIDFYLLSALLMLLCRSTMMMMVIVHMAKKNRLTIGPAFVRCLGTHLGCFLG